MIRQPEVSCRRSFDYDEVRQVAAALWHEIDEPALPDPVPLSDSMLDRFTFIEVLVDGTRSGFFAIDGNDFHAMLMPNARGSIAVRAADECFRLLRDQLGYIKLIAAARINRPEVRWYARKIGFKPVKRDEAMVTYTKEL